MNQSTREMRDSIKRLEDMKKKVHKEVSKKGAGAVEKEGDMHLYTYKKPDLEHTNWTILHNNCVSAGTTELISWGYIFTRTTHYSSTDLKNCRVKCTHCGLRMNEEFAKTYENDQITSILQKREEYRQNQEIREEWEAEQILLGKL